MNFKKITSIFAAAAIAISAIPSNGFGNKNADVNAQVTPYYASEYNIPDVKITSSSIPDLEALKFTSNMTLGFNLGNTFDAFSDTTTISELDFESMWVGVKTTKAMIDTIKAAGFKTIRVPVSWHNHVDKDYKISEAWLSRVKEVVDYAVANDMYIILNIHHDNSKEFMYPDSAHLDQSVKYVSSIWTQLADRFKDYNEKLVFESLNEPRLVGHQNEWWFNPNSNDCVDAANSINTLNQKFVDIVRNSGGNNAKRYLMVPGYCASIDGVTNSYFKVPTDTATNKIILSVHAYTPYNFALQAENENGSVSTFDSDTSSDTREIDSLMSTIYNRFISKGIPVVIGEFGARNKSGNTQDRIDFATYYIAAARAKGITCVWWDNNAFTSGEAFGLLDRKTLTWKYPEIVQGLSKYSGNTSTIYIETTATTVPVQKEDFEGVLEESLDGYTVTFGQAIGDTMKLDIELSDIAVYGNGCVAFSVNHEGTNYWVAFQWETSKSGLVTVDLTTPYQVLNTITEEKETDEAIVKAVVAAAQSMKSATVQKWYAADAASWDGIDAKANINIKAASVSKAVNSETTTTEATTTVITTTPVTTTTNVVTTTPVITTTTSENTTTTTTSPDVTRRYGDLDSSKNIDLADLVTLNQYLIKDITFTSEQLKYADLNSDGTVDIADGALLKQFLMGDNVKLGA